MRGSSSAFAALLVAAALLAAQGCGSGQAEEITEAWKLNECRANMNTLATDQALHMLTTGKWTGSVAKLDSIGQRRRPLVCPACGEPYAIHLYEGGYVISCPIEEHGSVDTGVPSWGEGTLAESAEGTER
jgi:hypothetical protein